MLPDIRAVADAEFLVLDTETTGTDWKVHRMFSFSGALPQGEPFYADIRTEQKAMRWLRDAVKYAKLTVMHNAKFDMHMLANEGISIANPHCTMITAALIDENQLSYSLDSLCLLWLQEQKISIEAAIARALNCTEKQAKGRMAEAPREIIEPYAKRDADLTRSLHRHEQIRVRAEKLDRVQHLERRLLPVAWGIERRGVRVDVQQAEASIPVLTKQIDELQRELDGIAGTHINANPSNSLRNFLVKQGNVLIDGTKVELTPEGKPSITAEVLRKMTHPAASKILGIRQITKVRDTFVKGHVLSYHRNGRVHPTVNTVKGDDAGTGTGRLSITEPALQQLSSRNETYCKIVRSLFLPNEGERWLAMDWDSFEFRMFAHFLNDERINLKYRNDPGTDFHQAVADLVGIPRTPSYSGEPNAKQLNLALVFGAGEGKTAHMLGLPCHYETNERTGKRFLKPGPEAAAVFAKYHAAVPGVRDLLNKYKNIAKSQGYIETLAGRHIRFPGGEYTHKAGGLEFQGSSADCMKLKLIELDAEFPGRLLLTVHDEIALSVHNDADCERAREIYTSFSPEDEITLNIPIRASFGIGNNWYRAGTGEETTYATDTSNRIGG